ncbi:hypothetical protein Tco_1007573 [Tanacetum coccineum]
MAQLTKLAIATNSIVLKEMLQGLFEIDNARAFKFIRETHTMVIELTAHCKQRGKQIVELEFLVGSNVSSDYVQLLRELQDAELEKARTMMKLISETHLKVLKKISFVVQMRKK